VPLNNLSGASNAYTNPYNGRHPNVNGVPYASPIDFTHSSALRSLQKIFGVDEPLLRDAATSPDLADLFAPGATTTIALEFTDPTNAAITYTTRVLHGTVVP
jgi:hypothetical protein